MPTENFDDIRPYNEQEVPAAVNRIAGSEIMPAIAAYVYPGEPVQTVARRISSVKNCDELLHWARML